MGETGLGWGDRTRLQGHAWDQRRETLKEFQGGGEQLFPAGGGVGRWRVRVGKFWGSRGRRAGSECGEQGACGVRSGDRQALWDRCSPGTGPEARVAPPPPAARPHVLRLPRATGPGCAALCAGPRRWR